MLPVRPRCASTSARSAATDGGVTWPTGRHRTPSLPRGIRTLAEPSRIRLVRAPRRSATTRAIRRPRSAARAWTATALGRRTTASWRHETTSWSSPARPSANRKRSSAPVSLRLRVRGSSPNFDIFARLCDVDAKGTSWNICDGLLRLDGTRPADADGWTQIEVPMSATAHRFAAGHRLRVQVSGGAHPRWTRNTGTSEQVATATSLAPVDIEISHPEAVLSLPVVRAGARDTASQPVTSARRPAR